MIINDNIRMNGRIRTYIHVCWCYKGVPMQGLTSVSDLGWWQAVSNVNDIIGPALIGKVLTHH